MTTTTGSVFSRFVQRLNETSAELAAEAERLGVSREEAAAALAAEVQHAVTRDAELDAMRDDFRADLARHRADVAAYRGRSAETRARLESFLDRLAALADEVTAFTGEIVALDDRGKALADRARPLGEPAVPVTRLLEDLGNELHKDPSASFPMARLAMRSQHGRVATVEALAEATCNQRREP